MASYSPEQLDKKYNNWVKAQLAVLITRKGIEPFVCNNIQRFQLKSLDEICYYNRLFSGTKCSNCCTENVVKCPTYNVCNVSRRGCKYHKTVTTQYIPTGCQNNICHHFKTEIQNVHIFNSPSYKNTDATQWCENPWEVAKCFMPPDGYKVVACASETDLNGLISIIINCKVFQTKIHEKLTSRNNIFDQARKIGGSVRYSPCLEVEDYDLQRYFRILQTLLSDSGYFDTNMHAQTAKQKLANLEHGTYVIDKDAINEALDDVAKAAQDKWKTTVDKQEVKYQMIRLEIIQRKRKQKILDESIAIKETPEKVFERKRKDVEDEGKTQRKKTKDLGKSKRKPITAKRKAERKKLHEHGKSKRKQMEEVAETQIKKNKTTKAENKKIKYISARKDEDFEQHAKAMHHTMVDATNPIVFDDIIKKEEKYCPYMFDATSLVGFDDIIKKEEKYCPYEMVDATIPIEFDDIKKEEEKYCPYKMIDATTPIGFDDIIKKEEEYSPLPREEGKSDDFEQQTIKKEDMMVDETNSLQGILDAFKEIVKSQEGKSEDFEQQAKSMQHKMVVVTTPIGIDASTKKEEHYLPLPCEEGKSEEFEQQAKTMQDMMVDETNPIIGEQFFQLPREEGKSEDFEQQATTMQHDDVTTPIGFDATAKKVEQYLSLPREEGNSMIINDFDPSVCLWTVENVEDLIGKGELPTQSKLDKMGQVFGKKSKVNLESYVQTEFQNVQAEFKNVRTELQNVNSKLQNLEKGNEKVSTMIETLLKKFP